MPERKQRRLNMARVDGWTDEHVDCAIALLVQAEKLLIDVSPVLSNRIRRFLLEKA
jgi:hypothetical protein